MITMEDVKQSFEFNKIRDNECYRDLKNLSLEQEELCNKLYSKALNILKNKSNDLEQVKRALSISNNICNGLFENIAELDCLRDFDILPMYEEEFI